MYATGWILAGLLLLGGAVAFGALEWAAALGTGTATGTLHIDRCEMTPGGSRSSPTRVCSGEFRSDAGEVDEHAEAPSESRVGESIRVTRTLLDDYIQQGGRNASEAAARTLIFTAVGIGCLVAGVAHANAASRHARDLVPVEAESQWRRSVSHSHRRRTGP
ncbi:hypothetical protein ACFV06_14170 [Streptomyces sp. NPDC059618]|uniref:hypothetical protein n=1 Tax=Streptomyces sp. NPDC059618 TaxID=3346887 RepID=UPI00369DCD5D